MTPGETTHVVLLTPEGRGAVASLLVEGPAATAIVGRLFHSPGGRPLGERTIGRIVYGRWSSAEAGEEVIVCRRDERQVEIHCHGGAAAAAAIVNSLCGHGASVVPWRDWIRQSAADPIAAAAEIALVAAPTERTAAILWDQRGGALTRALDDIARLVAAGEIEQSCLRVDELLAWCPLGLHLVDPWRVVLAGRPNVGKSSLINALLGFRRTIVHPAPGTTRDIVTAAAALDGWPIELSDTAGLHASADPLEQAGIRLAREHLASADLVALVFDASSPWSGQDDQLAGQWPEALRVFNKCDLIRPKSHLTRQQAGLYTSAIDGEGLGQLQREIASRLLPQAPNTGQAVPFLAVQAALLTSLRDALAGGQSAAAADLLASREKWAGESC